MMPVYVFLVFCTVLTIGPFVWMFLTSVKTYQEAIQIPPTLFPENFQWRNYAVIAGKFPFLKLYFNTIVVVLFVVAGQLVISSMAAYAFARLRFPGQNILFVVILGLLMIPGQIFLIPHYKIMAGLKITNTLTALILPGLFNVFGVFLLKQFFMTIPVELDEAAIMDGAGYFHIYRRIILPLSQSGLMSLSILTALWTWKSLMWPIIVNRSLSKMTLSAGLAFLIGEHTTYYEQVMAGGVISVLPMIVIFLFLQKRIVQGIALSGIKG